MKVKKIFVGFQKGTQYNEDINANFQSQVIKRVSQCEIWHKLGESDVKNRN